MPTQIQDLPDELLAATLEYLPKLDLKLARLACVRWSNVGAEMLFSRVYFAPRRGVIESFSKITAHPIFSKTIKEIVYDGRLYLPRFAADTNHFRHEFEGKYRIPGDDEEDDQFDDGPTRAPLSSHCLYAHKVYKQLFNEQDIIFTKRLDVKALDTGLIQMPNIRIVRLLDTFTAADWLPVDDDSHECYNARSPSISYSLTMPPSYWDEGNNDEHHDQNLDQRDCRGILCFF